MTNDQPIPAASPETEPSGAASAPRADAAPVISVAGLTKRYRHFVAVHEASFEVAPGEIFGILGPNGAGKTTTVECLQGLRHADGGEIRVLGLDPRKAGKTLRRRLGSQLQSSALPDHMKVWEALDLFSSFSRRGRDWRTLMDEWGLSAKRSDTFRSLSGGQRQRLFVALALLNDPEIVFLDEMTTGLDPAARRVAWDLIREIRERGATVVLVTHFLDEAERLCDRLAIMEGGRVLGIDTPRGFVARHAPGVRVVFSTGEKDLSWLRGVEGVVAIERFGRQAFVLGSGPILARVAAALVEHGIVPDDLRLEEPTLEDAYLAMTGHVALE